MSKQTNIQIKKIILKPHQLSQQLERDFQLTVPQNYCKQFPEMLAMVQNKVIHVGSHSQEIVAKLACQGIQLGQCITIPSRTKMLLYGMSDPPNQVQLLPFQKNSNDQLASFQISLYYFSKINQAKKQFSKKKLQTIFKNKFHGMYFNFGQVVEFYDGKFRFQATIILEKGSFVNQKVQRSQENLFGFITENTKIYFKPGLWQEQAFILKSSQESDTQNSSQLNENKQNPQSQCEFNYKEKLHKIKAGGLSEQIDQIARRIFASRKFGGLLVQRLAINHAKGLLFYGPPGTGKTLLARQMSKILDVRPTIVNGPEIMDKYVGQGQRKLRQIFQPAIDEYKLKGNESNLHVIIFDEIDSIAKRRGGSDSSIGDSLVNQLLTLIDGVDSPKNILVIGITNRKDLIDDALLRSGRLEVHIQVYLPTQQGRKQIFDIHLKMLKKQGLLAQDVDSQQLAKITKNYTGAEIQSLVKSSFSFAAENVKSSGKSFANYKEVRIQKKHFLRAKNDIKPQFGQDQKQIDNLIPDCSLNLLKYMPKVELSLENWLKKCNKIKQGNLTLLIKGPPRSGKTVLSLCCSKKIDMPFTKLVNVDKIYHLTQSQKMAYIIKVLEDSKRCSHSCIILDDIFRLIEFIPLSSKYNNNLLQLIINFICLNGQKNKKRVIIATCSDSKSLPMLQKLGIKGFMDCIQMETFSHIQMEKILEQNEIKMQNKIEKQTQSDSQYQAQEQQENNEKQPKKQERRYTIGDVSDMLKYAGERNNENI